MPARVYVLLLTISVITTITHIPIPLKSSYVHETAVCRTTDELSHIYICDVIGMEPGRYHIMEKEDDSYVSTDPFIGYVIDSLDESNHNRPAYVFKDMWFPSHDNDEMYSKILLSPPTKDTRKVIRIDTSYLLLSCLIGILYYMYMNTYTSDHMTIRYLIVSCLIWIRYCGYKKPSSNEEKKEEEDYDRSCALCLVVRGHYPHMCDDDRPHQHHRLIRILREGDPGLSPSTAICCVKRKVPGVTSYQIQVHLENHLEPKACDADKKEVVMSDVTPKIPETQNTPVELSHM
jgi:hypothetical protein